MCAHELFFLIIELNINVHITIIIMCEKEKSDCYVVKVLIDNGNKSMKRLSDNGNNVYHNFFYP